MERTLRVHGAGKRANRPDPRTVHQRAAKPRRERPDVVLRLLLLGTAFAVTFYAINADWFLLRHVDVRGGVRLSDREVISLAALDDFPDAWTVFVPRERLRRSLESNPLIEHAELAITSPWSIRIRIMERDPLAALEQNGFRLLFDRTGELVSIVRPGRLCLYPMLRGVPAGLLKSDGVPICRVSEAWALPAGWEDARHMGFQFGRAIYLQQLLERYPSVRQGALRSVCMDRRGRLSLEYEDCPPILLGEFSNPEVQFRRVLAVLSDETITDPARTVDIDLSSELFPCYHVREEYLTREERRQITEWEAASRVAESVDEAESAEEVELGDSGNATGIREVYFDPGIFSLAGGESSRESSDEKE